MLTKNELAELSELLELAAENLMDQSCNDYTLEPSAENRALLIKCYQYLDENDWPYDESLEEVIAEVEESEDELFVFDFALCTYFAARCKDAANNGAAITPHEYQAIADALNNYIERFEDIAETNGVDEFEEIAGMRQLSERCSAVGSSR